MPFLRWVKFKAIRAGSLAASLLSFIGAIYSYFYFADPVKLVGAVAGIFLGVAFIIVSNYYKVKLQNLFFLKEKKGNGVPAAEA